MYPDRVGRRGWPAELAVLRERLKVSMSELIAYHRARSPFAYLMDPATTLRPGPGTQGEARPSER